VILSVVLGFSAAQAGPAVVVLGVDSAGGEAQAFARGAREMTERPPEAAEAADALRRAEQAFLELDFAAAEHDLTTAVQYDLSSSERPVQAEQAFRATVRLAQVLLARKRPRAADRLLMQALDTWPGFPGSVAPPPDVSRRLSRARRARRAQQSLQISSRPVGLEARLNGINVGRTPVTVDDLVAGPHVACVEGRLDVRCRSVDVGARNRVTLIAEPPAARGSLANSIEAGNAEAGWSALADLEAALSADETCVAHAGDDGVVVARISGRRRLVLGGRRAPRPGAEAGWAVLGRLCGGGAPSNLRPSEVVDRLWGPPAGGALISKQGWGWISTGSGVAAAGLGVAMGLAAQGAADAYNRDGRPADADAARSSALIADVSYVSAAVLLTVGLVLLLTD
jgi:hypothetical protein